MIHKLLKVSAVDVATDFYGIEEDSKPDHKELKNIKHLAIYLLNMYAKSHFKSHTNLACMFNYQRSVVDYALKIIPKVISDSDLKIVGERFKEKRKVINQDRDISICFNCRNETFAINKNRTIAACMRCGSEKSIK